MAGRLLCASVVDAIGNERAIEARNMGDSHRLDALAVSFGF